MEREQRVKTCTYKVCRMERETRVKQVPYTVCRMERKLASAEVPYTVCKPVHYTKTISVPRRVCRRVPVTVTRCVPRVVCEEVPVTICCDPKAVSPEPSAPGRRRGLLGGLGHSCGCDSGCDSCGCESAGSELRLQLISEPWLLSRGGISGRINASGPAKSIAGRFALSESRRVWFRRPSRAIRPPRSNPTRPIRPHASSFGEATRAP
ncbi:MAG: hypothetical protein R3B96_19710 [Pirellulaceae bacterium]